jgi:flagellar biosynthesis/type III secretory pathway protein FliH
MHCKPCTATTRRREKMSEPLPALLSRDSPVAKRARPLWEDARVLKGRVVSELGYLDAEISTLYEEAHRAVEEARQQAQAIEEEARQRGEKEGLAQCMEHLAAARSEYKKLRSRAEHDMVTLAFHIARRLIGHAIEVQPEVVRDIVGEVLVTARGRQQIVVLVHPEDRRELEANRHEYARELDGVPVHFEGDASLERGGCVIETESGRIDARLETQLKVLREALMEGHFDVHHVGRQP